MADENIGRTGLRTGLEAGAEFVALGRRIERVDDLAETVAE